MLVEAPPSEKKFHLLVTDYTRDQESWAVFAVIHFTDGALQMCDDMPSTVSDEQMNDLLQLCDDHGIHFASEGSGDAGQPFANAPWFQWYKNHVIISQSGGLDV